MADEATNRQCFAIQAAYCEASGAPITGAVNAALAEGLDRSTETGRRVLDWPGQPLQDALPLRLVGGFHALARSGREAGLARVFDGAVNEAPAAVMAALKAHDAELVRWLDGPPQTNEPGRSAALMTGLMHLARGFGLPFQLLEIGSSAGLNLLIDRYRFDLGGTMIGPEESPVTIRPEWRGSPPEAAEVRIDAIRGVDIAPIDVGDAAQAERLTAYIWADQKERFGRVDQAIGMIRERPVSLEQGDAADWIEARLAEPQPAGTMRVLMHSIVWQYIPEPGQRRIEAAMAAAGARATAERPLGWVSLEADRTLLRHDLRVRSWPGGEDAVLANTHPHVFWVEPV